MHELQSCGLPGDDYVVLAANVTMDEWIPRPARYGDFSRALHLLLMVYGGEIPETVIEYTPHGCRHVLLTSAQQLAQQGKLSVPCMESLGHWERGSKMPKHYDAAACVTELQARKTISDAVKSGWRPAGDGELPQMVGQLSTGCPTTSSCMPSSTCTISSTSSSVSIKVLNRRKRTLHLNTPPSTVTICKWFTCGTMEHPATSAVFNPNEEESGQKKCRNCYLA